MAKFRFCGNPVKDEDGNRIDTRQGGIEAFGLKFNDKTYTEVKGGDIVAKLRGNGHFEEQTS